MKRLFLILTSLLVALCNPGFADKKPDVPYINGKIKHSGYLAENFDKALVTSKAFVDYSRSKKPLVVDKDGVARLKKGGVLLEFSPRARREGDHFGRGVMLRYRVECRFERIKGEKVMVARLIKVIGYH